MVELPPLITGHPTAWAVRARSVPKALVRGAVNDMAWAPTPASSALASSDWNRRTAQDMGRRPREPEPGQGHRMSGNGSEGPEYVVGDGQAVADQRLHQAPVGGPIGTQFGHRLVQGPVCRHGTAPVEGLGKRHRRLAQASSRRPSKAG